MKPVYVEDSALNVAGTGDFRLRSMGVPPSLRISAIDQNCDLESLCSGSFEDLGPLGIPCPGKRWLTSGLASQLTP